MAFEFEHSLTLIHRLNPAWTGEKTQPAQYTLVALVRLRVKVSKGPKLGYFLPLSHLRPIMVHSRLESLFTG